MDEKVYASLLRFLKERDIPWLAEEPMSRHTTFRIGGPAQIFCRPETLEQAAALRGYCAGEKIDCLILGNGSDLLVSDRGIKGVVLCTAALTLLQLLSENKIRAMAGAQLGELCRFAQREKLSGLEFAYGIPGTVGGAVFMNAGAYGGEIKQVLCSCRYLSPVGETVELSCEEMELSYRHSVFSSHPEWMVLSADFRLNAGDGKEIQDKMEDLMGRRKAKQPLDFPSGGSTFKRPEGYFAAALIEQCGLKGFQIGQAAVSEKHAGFCVNLGNASCQDMIKLMRHIRETVLRQTGVLLEPEVRLVGEFLPGELL